MIETWFEKYVELIYKYIFFMVKDHQIAEDLTQETFIKAHIKSHQYKGNSELKTWLYRIAYTTTMNYFRKKHPIPTLFDSPIHVKSAEESFLEKSDLEELYRAISTLKLSYQQVIILRKIQQLSVKDTAAILRWSESKVKMTTARALEKLKLILGEKGGMEIEESSRS
ncbi:RNA polymerase sigma factor [Oceanobacillus luteolus]|uniref:RNA polymerase sigma factor n=1 Tax=Oceanobacillus luteolus TaxID=1274358 RepID=A0ABW4HUL0_9BACI|nr:RNA polymerase sigma factor [Oceanobacillus luteolus]